MRFPNAHKGLKKIKTSVVLEIISFVVMLVGAILSMVVLDKSEMVPHRRNLRSMSVQYSFA